MKKYGVLFLLNLLVLFSINRYYQYSEDVPQPLAYRFTFICPQTWDDVAAGMEEADRDLGTDTKYVGFKNSNEGKQAEAIRSAVYAEADGIITVGNNNSKVIGAAVEEAEEASDSDGFRPGRQRKKRLYWYGTQRSRKAGRRGYDRCYRGKCAYRNDRFRYG